MKKSLVVAAILSVMLSVTMAASMSSNVADWHTQEGDAMNLSSSSWAANENITVQFNDNPVALDSASNKISSSVVRADGSGSWWAVFTIPDGSPSNTIGAERVNATGETNTNVTGFTRDPNQVSLTVQLTYGGSGSNARNLDFTVEDYDYPYYSSESQSATTDSSGQATVTVNEGSTDLSMNEQGRIGAKSETTLIGTDTGSYTWAIALEGAEPGGEVVYPEEGTTTTSTSGQRNLLYGLAIILLFVGGYLVFFKG